MWLVWRRGACGYAASALFKREQRRQVKEHGEVEAGEWLGNVVSTQALGIHLCSPFDVPLYNFLSLILASSIHDPQLCNLSGTKAATPGNMRQRCNPQFMKY